MLNTNNIHGTSVPQDKKIVKIIIDDTGYNTKPTAFMGAITNRMSKPENIHQIDLNQLSKFIINGHTFSVSYAEGGMTDKNFISSDLVGLDFDGELTVNDVLETLKKYNIPANIVYYTYSHGEKGERFRVITALKQTVTNKDEYKQIIKGYQSIFENNIDNATVAAVQRFLGTNKGLAKEIDPYNTADKQIFLDLYNQNCKTVDFQVVKQNKSNLSSFDLKTEIDNYNILDYIRKTYPKSEFKSASSGVFVNPCPFCGHNDHLHITGNKFHSFGDKDCLALGGVGIVQWIMFTENLTIGQAIAKFKYELLGIDEKEDKKAYAQAMAQKEQAERINKQSSNNDNNKQKKPYFKIENLEQELQNLGYTLKFNQITNSKDFFKDGNKLSKKEENTIATSLYSELCDKYKGININLIERYLHNIARYYEYNPVLDLFNTNKWDGNDHLTKIYNALGIKQEDKLSK